MKKIILSALTIIMMIASVSVYAFADDSGNRDIKSEDYYKITVPSSFTKYDDNKYPNAKKGDVFLFSEWKRMDESKQIFVMLSVAVSYTDKEYDIKNADTKKLQDYGNDLLKKYTLSSEMVFDDAKKVKINGNYALKISCADASEDKNSVKTSTDMYFIAYGNNLYSIQLTSNDIDTLNGEEVKNILDSFSYNSDKDRAIIISIISIIIVAVAVVVVVKAIKTKKSITNDVSGQ